MIDFENFPDVDVYESPLKDSSAKLYVLRGGWNHPTPKQYMDEAVREFIETTLHNQFVEIHLDIPQVRVLIVGINDLPYKSIEQYYAELACTNGR